MSRPALARVKELLSYDSETGRFHWLVTRNNFAKAGSDAGSWNGAYRYIYIDNKSIPAHRLAWLLTYGEWPQQHIDHIDGNPANNAIANLRDVDRSTNLSNQRRPRADNTTGYLGVTRKRNKFAAVICVRGRDIHIGTYPTALLASAAYHLAKAELHGVQL